MPALRPGQSVVGDLSTNWTTLDPILPRAVIGIENDTGKGKIGNGVDRWTSLSYNIAPPVSPPSLSPYMKKDGTVAFTGYVSGLTGATNLGNLITWQDVQQLHYEMPERHPVRVASTENVDVEVVTAIDGVTLNVGDRVLLKDQTDKKQNGVYVYLDDEVVVDPGHPELINGDFETGSLSPWVDYSDETYGSVTTDSDITYDTSAYSVKLELTAGGSNIFASVYQELDIVEGSLSVNLYGATSNAGCHFLVMCEDDTADLQNTVYDITPEENVNSPIGLELWSDITVYIPPESAAGCTRIKIMLYSDTGIANVCYIDNIEWYPGAIPG